MVRRIVKRAEPPCLAGLRREQTRVERETGKPPNSKDWDPGQCGDTMRQALCAEQHGLCAYCMRRIRPDGRHMKIEHFVARAADARQMYDWGNLLGVCTGVIDGPEGSIRTCDTARGERELYIHPCFGVPPEKAFSFEKTGLMIGRVEGGASDLEALNLNTNLLVGWRRQVVDLLRRKLRKDDSRRNLERLLRVATTPTQRGLPEYARVMREYLEKKLQTRM